jgi:ankyrin repeat protein
VRVRHLCEATSFKAVTSEDGKQHTPLHWASLNNAVRVAQYLIDNGAKTDVSLPRDPTAEAANRPRSSLVRIRRHDVRCLQAKEADFGQTPLHWAVLRGHVNMVRVA